MNLEYRVDHRGVVQLQTIGGGERSYGWHAFTMLLLAMLVGLGWLYFSGYLTPVSGEGGLQTLSLRGKMNEQANLLEKQGEQILQLEGQSAAEARSRQIQEAAYEELRSKLSLAENELAEARERLLLYEDILSPQELGQGLRIQHFAIKQRVIDAEGKKLAEDRFYQYHLVLANVRGGDAVVNGRYELKVSGQQKGKKAVLTLKDLQAPAVGSQQAADRFSLKYYQSIEGNIELPEAFVPESVGVVLDPAASGDKVSKTYDWSTFKLSKKSTANKESN